jgi:hypothetical protein
VADSESNIIRAIDFETGVVTTLAGGDLFDFGDRDGVGDEVRLQHPLGLFALGDKILIADTYNHKIKQLDPATRSIQSLFGTGKPGQGGGTAPSFYEPAGLSAAHNKLYVADTNNHAVRVIDLTTKAVSTLLIKDLQPPVTSVVGGSESDALPNAEEVLLERQLVRAAGDGALVINVALPAGYHLNPMAPQRYRVSVEKRTDQFNLFSPVSVGLVGSSQEVKQTSKNLKLPLRIPFSANPGEVELKAQLTLFYCREDNTGECRIKTLIWRVPVSVVSDANASQEIRIQGRVTIQ